MGDEVSRLIGRLRDGDRSAFEELVPVVYGELRRMATSYLRQEGVSHTLQPTALVHEAYLRMIAANRHSYCDRAHFFGVAANVMRRILVDHARSRYAAKRGGRVRKLAINEALDFSPERASAVVALDEALDNLARTDSIKARVVELRFFGGMTAEEIAEHLSLTRPSVQHHLRWAMAWLHREVCGPIAPASREARQ
jgi:RNA polymerase sigma-70 factor, ECF subfamily